MFVYQLSLISLSKPSFDSLAVLHTSTLVGNFLTRISELWMPWANLNWSCFHMFPKDTPNRLVVFLSVFPNEWKKGNKPKVWEVFFFNTIATIKPGFRFWSSGLWGWLNFALHGSLARILRCIDSLEVGVEAKHISTEQVSKSSDWSQLGFHVGLHHVIFQYI